MQIFEAYLHVLDAQSNVKLLSERPMQLDLEISEYIGKHIEGFFEHLDIANSNLANATKLSSEGLDFKELTLVVADLFFDTMQKTEGIKPCDLMCLNFKREDIDYYGFLKLNFRTSYAHAVEIEDNLITNKIIRQVTTLPYKSQKVEEGFLMDRAHNLALIKDKLVTIDGSKSRYIAEEVLGIQADMTVKRKIDLITKSAQKVMEKYDDQPLVKTAAVKKMITAHLDENGALDMSTIVNQCFDTKVAREAYVQELQDKGIEPESVMINETQRKKLKRTQKIKTASGVEIVLPFEYVSRSENLNIITQPDGSISIELRNLGEIL